MRVMFIGWIFVAYEYAVRVSDSVILVDLQYQFHLSASSLSILSSAYYFTYIGSMLFASILIDYVGIFRAWKLAISILVAGCLLFGSALNLEMLVIARILMGFGSAFAITGTFALSIKNSKNSGLFIGITMLAAMLGAFFGQGPWIELTNLLVHWERVYWLVAIVGLILLMLWTKFGKVAEITLPKQSWKDLGRNFKRLLKSPIFWLLSIFMGMLSTPQTAFSALWGPSFIKLAYQISQTKAAYMTSVITIGGLFGAIFFGWLGDKVKNIKLLLIFCGVITVLLFSLMILRIFTVLFALASILFLLGAVTNSNVVIFAFLGRKFVSLPSASVQGAANTFNMLGGPIFQILIGFAISLQISNIKEQLSLSSMYSALWIIPISIFIITFILIIIPSKKFNN